MSAPAPVVATGAALEVPGVASAAELLDASGPAPAAEFRPEEVLGRRGLRYKDRATRLALCASKRALLDAGLPAAAAERDDAESFGVVVASNLGNVDTVCRVVDQIRSGGVESTSPMDLPNASSNVVASSVAIWFGFGALNLTLCSGATSGADALHVAANALRAGRARRMLVVGVETTNEPVARLMRASAERWSPGARDVRVLDGAAAVVLERAGDADGRAAAVVEGYGWGPDVARSLRAAGAPAARPSLWLVPPAAYAPTADEIAAARSCWDGAAPARTVDVARAAGDAYGALGVLQCVLACEWLRAHPGDGVAATSGASWGDGAATVVVRGPRAGAGR